MNEITDWYNALEPRERLMVTVAGIALAVTLFYLMLWEPVYKGLYEEQLKNENQTANLAWMQQAASEVRSLKASGASTNVRNQNAPVSLSVEQTIGNAGIKDKLSKLESSGQDSARAILDNVSFNQMVLWLNTLESNFGISVSSATIERTESAGIVDARLTLSRDK